jgi:hypothetical protein
MNPVNPRRFSEIRSTIKDRWVSGAEKWATGPGRSEQDHLQGILSPVRCSHCKIRPGMEIGSRVRIRKWGTGAAMVSGVTVSA